jgi:hypothetical protein
MPHEDHTLLEHLPDQPDDRFADVMQEFFRGVANYRKVGFFGNDDVDAARSRKRTPRLK